MGTLLDKAVERQHNDEEAAGENTNGMSPPPLSQKNGIGVHVFVLPTETSPRIEYRKRPTLIEHTLQRGQGRLETKAPIRERSNK